MASEPQFSFANISDGMVFTMGNSASQPEQAQSPRISETNISTQLEKDQQGVQKIVGAEQSRQDSEPRKPTQSQQRTSTRLGSLSEFYTAKISQESRSDEVIKDVDQFFTNTASMSLPIDVTNSLFQVAVPLLEHIPKYMPELDSDVDLLAPSSTSLLPTAPSSTILAEKCSTKYDHQTLWHHKLVEPDKFSFQLTPKGPSLCKSFFLYHNECSKANCPYSHDFEEFGAASTKASRLLEVLSELRRLDSAPNLTNGRLVDLLSRKPRRAKASQIPGSFSQIEMLLNTVICHDKQGIAFSPLGPTICREHLLEFEGCQADCGYSHDLTPLRLGDRSKDDFFRLYTQSKAYDSHCYVPKLFNTEFEMEEGQKRWDYGDLNLKQILQALVALPEHIIEKLFESSSIREERNKAEGKAASTGKQAVPKAALSTSSTIPNAQDHKQQSGNIEIEDWQDDFVLYPVQSTASMTTLASASLLNPVPKSKKEIRDIAGALANKLHIEGLSGAGILILITTSLMQKEEPIIPKLANELADALGEEGLTGAHIQQIVDQEHIKAIKKVKSAAAKGKEKAVEEKVTPTKKEKNKAALHAKLSNALLNAQLANGKKAVLDETESPGKVGSSGRTKKVWTGNRQEESLIARLAKEGKTIGDVSHFVKASGEESLLDDLDQSKGARTAEQATQPTEGVSDPAHSKNEDTGLKIPTGPSKKSKTAKAHYADGEVVGSSAPEIQADSFGYKLLERHGWSKGQALGAVGADDKEKTLVPLMQKIKLGKEGLK